MTDVAAYVAAAIAVAVGIAAVGLAVMLLYPPISDEPRYLDISDNDSNSSADSGSDGT